MSTRSQFMRFLESDSPQSEVLCPPGSEDALREIAESTLSVDQAWAVKIVQSIVAGTKTGEIRIECGASTIVFRFAGTSYTYDEFLSAFYNPEPSSNRSLSHLLRALWSLGVQEFAAFEVALAGQVASLIWDGYKMHRVSSPVKLASTSISLAPRRYAPEVPASWTDMFSMSSSNTKFDDLRDRLSRICYPCPLPLSLDGSRLDSLWRAEFHGASDSAFPLTIGFSDPPLPALGFSPGTFSAAHQSAGSTESLRLKHLRGAGWGKYAADRFTRLLPRSSAGMAFSLCVNMEWIRQGKSGHWKACQGRSTVYWILDGALVGNEDLLDPSTHCSLGCFVSAEGLPIDPVGLMLERSPERTARFGNVRQAALEAVQAIDPHTFDDLIAFGRRPQLNLGVAMMLTSVLVMPLGLLGGLVGASVSGMVLAFAGFKERGLAKAVETGLRELSGLLASATDDG